MITIPSLKLINQIECNHEATRTVKFNHDGNYCISGGSDNRISLWNPHSGKLLKTYSGHAGEITDVAATTDNSFIASGSEDKSVLLWDVTSGVAVNRWRKHLGKVNTIALNNESNIVFSGSVDKHVYAWDRKSRNIQPVQSLLEAKDSIVGIVSHKWIVVTASVDMCFRTYDLRHGIMNEDFLGYIPVGLDLAEDCHMILTNCNDNTIRMFDKEDGALLKELSGHLNNDYRINCSFFNNSTEVISGSVGSSIYVWNILTGKLNEKVPVPLLKSTKNKSVTTNVVHSISTNIKNKESILVGAGDHMFLYSRE